MRVTASKVGLLEHCAWSFRDEAQWVNSTSPAADKGTRFHAAIAHYVATGETPELQEDIALLFASAKAWVDVFGRDKLAAEVAFAWDPAMDVASVIGHDIGRAYGPWQERGALCGSADILAIKRPTKEGFIGDWSSGDGSRKGPQLRTLAVMLARAEGLESVRVQSLEVNEMGVRVVVDETLDSFALAAHAGTLSEGIASIGTSEPTPGDHCSKLYCAARATCPAGDAAVAQLVPAASLTRKLGAHIESPDHAAYMLNTIRLVEAKCSEIKALIKAYVPEGGVTLEDGSVLAEGTRTCERFDKGRALALLREKGATEEEIEQCSRSVVESSGLRVSGGAARARKRRAA